MAGDDGAGAGTAASELAPPEFGEGLPASLGEELEVREFTGQLRLRVPIPVPPGRSGFSPSLALVHGGGAANGPFGLGWSLSGGSVRRKADEGVPLYDDDVESDAFVLAGAGELVVVRGDGGAPDRRREEGGDVRVTRYRARSEGSFSRIERWTETATGVSHWRTVDAEGVHRVYGRSPGARIADPRDESRVAEWLLEEVRDGRGNVRRHVHAPEDLEGVDRGRPPEANRRPGDVRNRYLKEVRYGNTRPHDPDAGGLPEDNRWAYRVVLDYGAHDAERPSPEPSGTWPVRPDPFSRHRHGFEIRTYRLCRRLLVFHDLGPDEGARLVRSVDLRHGPRDDEGGLDTPEARRGVTLRAVGLTGYRYDGPDGRWSKSLPDLSLAYTRPGLGEAVETLDPDELPHGMADGQFLDLRGEGLTGSLSRRNGAWVYRRNLGGGEFGEPEPLESPSSARPGSSVFADLDVDGRTEAVSYDGPSPGSSELDGRTDRWGPHEAFPRSLRERWRSGQVSQADLTGSGEPDAFVSGPDQVVWYEGEGREGHRPATRTVRPRERAASPPQVARDPGVGTYLADMTGDGLTDVVRVRNGHVAYWPARGRGRFGRRVEMEGAPRIDRSDQFDPSRVRFADLTGAGGADLLYLGADGVSHWLNESGNAFGRRRTLEVFPPASRVHQVRVVDLLGTGPCLVWASPLPGDAHASIRYVQLRREPPFRLRRLENGMGKVTEVEHGSSVRHYLRDRGAGQPWDGVLPSHPAVVETVETRDEVTESRLHRRYRYHDGAWDGEERTFVGFGCVEVLDTEGFHAYPGLEADDYVGPSRTLTWYHTGLPPEERAPPAEDARAFDDDPDAAPTSGCWIEGGPPPSGPTRREAHRALAGRPLRREVREGGEAAPEVPYSVEERSWGVRVLQRAGPEEHGVTHVIPGETLTHLYEQDASDPRVRHEVVLEVDRFGSERRTADVAYPRRPGMADHEAQEALHVRVEEKDVLHERDRFHRLGIPLERRGFELAGLVPDRASVFSRRGLAAQAEAALQEERVRPHRERFEDRPPRPESRLLGRTLSRYVAADGSATAAAAEIEPPVRLHHTEETAFTDGLLGEALGDRVDDTRLRELGYLRHDGLWWKPSGRHDYLGPGDFRLRSATTDPLGATTRYSYDDDRLHLTSVVDPMGNETSAEIDPIALAPRRVRDPNENVTETRFDPLGGVIAVSERGEGLDGEGRVVDRGDEPLEDFRPRPEASLEEIIRDPHRFLQGATSFRHFDPWAWQRAGDGEDRQPVFKVQVARETHVSALEDGARSDVDVRIRYVDGLGRPAQTKERAGAGDAQVVRADGTVAEESVEERWRSSGRTVRDNKGRPVKKFEPYFSDTARYLENDVLDAFGVTTVHRYDPLGREVRVDTPRGFFREVRLTPWRRAAYDENDTVERSAYFQTRYRPGMLGEAAEEAVDQARAHADTPGVELLEPRGRAFLRRTRDEQGGPPLEELRVLDARGRERRVVDPRQREKNASRPSGDRVATLERTYDLLGRILVERSVDRGVRRKLADAAGRTVHAWTGRGHRITTDRDALGRPVSVRVGEPGGGPERTVETVAYADAGSSPGARSARRNARGRMEEHRDGAGVRTVERYDAAGRVLTSTRRLPAAVGGRVDWSGDDDVALEAGGHTTSSRYDALGRLTRRVLPDGTVQTPTYGADGHLASVRVRSGDGSVDTAVLQATEHDAHGRRTRAVYGNGVRRTFEHDPESLRLVRQVADRPAPGGGSGRETLQEIDYTYDPVGNLTRRDDATREHVLESLPAATPARPRHSTYEYDALYRLTRATGWVHQALERDDHAKDGGPPGPLKGTRHVTLDNGRAMEPYRRSYRYDAAGNRTEMRHVAESRSWTREMWVEDTSNRSLSRLDPGGNPRTRPADAFDEDGNRVDLDHLRRVEWDERGRLTVAVIDDTDVDGRPKHALYFGYAADGRRLRKVEERVADGVRQRDETLYLGDYEVRRVRRGGRAILERATVHVGDADETPASVFLWRRDERGLETDTPDTPRIHYRLTDRVGTTTLELGGREARVVSYEEHFPFGGSAVLAGDDVKEVRRRAYRYAGKERDDATGLYYFGRRYYAPWTGRWLSPDPEGPEDGLNLYRFVRNNPTGRKDRGGTQSSGLDEEERRALGALRRRSVAFSDLSESRQEKYRAEWETASVAGATFYVVDPAAESFSIQGTEADALLEEVTSEDLTVVRTDPELRKLAELDRTIQNDPNLRKIFDPDVNPVEGAEGAGGGGQQPGEPPEGADGGDGSKEETDGEGEAEEEKTGPSAGGEGGSAQGSGDARGPGGDGGSGDASRREGDGPGEGGKGEGQGGGGDASDGSSGSGGEEEKGGGDGGRRVGPSEEEVVEEFLDNVQTTLDVVGLVPGFGEPIDGINALISLGRGNYTDAALSAVAMVPVAGWGGTALKFGKKAGADDAAAKALKEMGEEGGGKVAREGAEEGGERVARESTEEGAEATGRARPEDAGGSKKGPSDPDDPAREMYKGKDGRKHHPDDPEGTWRDDNGRLHDSDTGQFVEDPLRKKSDDVRAARKANQARFRRDVARKIKSQEDHPLDFLLDQDGSLRSRRRKMDEMPEAPAGDAGHMKSKKALDDTEPDRLAVEDPDFNAMANETVESKTTFSYVEKGEDAVLIGGVPVDKRTAETWERLGKLDEGTVANAPKAKGWTYEVQ